MSTTRSLQRLFQRRKIKEFEEREKKFMEAHRENVRKYKCDFSANIVVVAEGKQAISMIKIIDATEMLEEEERKKKLKTSNKEVELKKGGSYGK
jgi:hypothetical protein